MFTRTIAAWALGIALLAGNATSTVAAPITFNFSFGSSGATAVGSITFESTLLPNPGSANFLLPNPAVLALQVTVSGATAGNGTFGIGSFNGVAWSTNGVTLNLGRELVGQPTLGSPWGSTGFSAGDFNLFAGAPAPNGTNPFTLSANGGAANAMPLISMAQVIAVPALDDWKLAVLALVVGVIGIVIVRRTHTARLSA